MVELKNKQLLAFEEYLHREEKSNATVEKYLRDVQCFYTFLGSRPVEKTETLAYKEQLVRQYAPCLLYTSRCV